MSLQHDKSTNLIEYIFSSGVSLANSGNPAVDSFSAIHVLYRHLSEEEVNILTHVVTAHEVGLVQHVRVIPKNENQQYYVAVS